MGKRGPKPTPTAELQRRGSWRAKEPRRKNEVKVDAAEGVPTAPGWLSKEAVALWPSVASRVYAAGYLADVDADMVGVLCESIATYTALRDEAGGEACYENSTGNKRGNPLVSMRRDALKDLRDAMDKLGMSPTARVGLVPSEPVKKEDTKHEGLKLFAKG